MTTLATTQETFLPRGRETVLEVRQLPSVPALFAKMVRCAMIRPSTLDQGVRPARVSLVHHSPGSLDSGAVRKFREICGYAPCGPVPAAYIQTRFIRLMGRYISAPFFPINPMGLIQVGQSYEQIRPVFPEERLDLSLSLIEMVQGEKGIHSRFAMIAQSRGETVWQGVATYFTRKKVSPSRKKAAPAPDTVLAAREAIRVPESTGRAYAGVSGDYNPHHLYQWTARFIGFNQPIAHGMWSLARTSASLEKAAGHPGAFSIEGALKLPIFMPALITLGYSRTGQGLMFELRDTKKGLPHLKGTFVF